MKQQRSEDYRGYRTAGIRLSEEWAPELRQGREQNERSALYAYHMFDKAHLVMMTEEGIISRELGAAMLGALRAMENEGIETVRGAVGGGMHSGETYLIRNLGEEIGGWEHLGRSSGDLGAVGQRIQERDRLLETCESINGLRGALLSLAEEHLDTVMPGWFHWQHAQPITLAHYFVAMAEGLARDGARAMECYGRVNRSPAGAVILTGTDFPLNRERTAALLGFDGVHVNTLDAIQDVDHTLECFTFLSILAAHLARLAEDIAIWAGTEFGYLDVADRYASGSSILMQMKTPTPPTYVKAALGAVVGAMTGAFVMSKGGTGSLGRVGALDAAFDEVLRSLHLLPPFLQSMKVNTDRARDEAAGHFAGGTDLAATLVRECGIPWRTAHQICGILFRICAEQAVTPDKLTPELLDKAALEYFDRPVGLSQEQISRALDPARFVRDRSLLGGPAPAETRRQIEGLRRGLTDDQQWLEARRLALTEAAAGLEQAIDAVVAG